MTVSPPLLPMAYAWPRVLNPEQVATFTAWGWTPQGWADMDQQVATRFGPSAVPVIAPRHRRELTLREWLRNPPTGSVTSIPSNLIITTLWVHGILLAPNVLDVYAAGAPERFVTVFLANAVGSGPRRDVITAWKIALAADLDDAAATGWAATGRLNVRKPAFGTLAEEARIVAHRITRWTQQCGPAAWLYVLAGMTEDEVRGMQSEGTTPSEAQLRVMVALNGVTLPSVC